MPPRYIRKFECKVEVDKRDPAKHKTQDIGTMYSHHVHPPNHPPIPPRQTVPREQQEAQRGQEELDPPEARGGAQHGGPGVGGSPLAVGGQSPRLTSRDGRHDDAADTIAAASHHAAHDSDDEEHLAENAFMAPRRRNECSARAFFRPLGALVVGEDPPSPADAHDVFAPPSHPASPVLVARSSATILTAAAASPLPPPLGPRAPQRSVGVTPSIANCKWPMHHKRHINANMRTRAGKITRRLPSPAARLSQILLLASWASQG